MSIQERWITDRLPEFLPSKPGDRLLISVPVIAVHRNHGIMIIVRVAPIAPGDGYFWQEMPYRRTYLSDQIAGWLPFDVLPDLPPGEYHPSNGSMWPTIKA